MKTVTKTIEELLQTNESPLNLSLIPNTMGINLSSVESITWTRQNDGQLVNLTINFIPFAQYPLNNKPFVEVVDG